VKSTLGTVGTLGLALVAAACGSDSVTKPKPPVGPDATCVAGTLTVGTTVNGDLSANGSSCLYPLFWDSSVSTLNVSYNFGVQAGKGYLVSEQAVWDNHAEMIGTSGGAKVTVAEADYSGTRQSTLPFVATSTTAYSVRVGADDDDPTNLAADTGAFVLRAQTCKVALPTVTDSVSHSDNLAPGDCTLPEGDFVGQDSSFVHLYTVHFTAGGTRTIYVTSAAVPLAIDMGGPGFDAYGYFNSNALRVGNTSAGDSFTFTAVDSGTFTMVVGTNTYSASSEAYTITFGAEIPAGPLHVTLPPMSSGSAVRRTHGLNARKSR
jgi:hypothetical protein